MITAAKLAFLLSAQQAPLQTMVGGELVNVSLPTTGYVFPGRSHDDHRETALGVKTGPNWQWPELANKLKSLPAGKPYRILVVVQMRAEASGIGSAGRPFPTQATLDRQEVADIRDGLALAGQIIRVQSAGALQPVFDIHLDSSIVPTGIGSLATMARMNRNRFDPEDSAAVEGYEQAWTIRPNSLTPDRLSTEDYSPRLASLGFWNGHLPLNPSGLAGDFARAYARCQAKIEADGRVRSGLDEVATPHAHPTEIPATDFAWSGLASGSFGSTTGEITEAVGRRNGRLTLMSREVSAPMVPSSFTLKATATGNASYFIVYGGPDMTYEIVGWLGPEGKQPRGNLGLGVLRADGPSDIAFTLPPSKFPVSEISLVPASEFGFAELRAPASLQIGQLSVEGLTVYTGFPVSTFDPLTALSGTDLSVVWAALEAAGDAAETPELRAKVIEWFRSANPALSRSAAAALRAWGSVDSIAALRAGLDKGPFEHTQGHAAMMLYLQILAKKLDPLADSSLIDDAAALIANRDWRTRKAAAKLLGQIPKDNANIAMLLMLGDPEPEVRLEALQGANLNIELVNQRLMYYAVNDPYEHVRSLAYARLLGSPRTDFRKEAEGFLADESPVVIANVLLSNNAFSPSVLRQAVVNPNPDIQAAALNGCRARSQKFEADSVKHLAKTDNLVVQMALAGLVAEKLIELPADALAHLKASSSPGVRALVTESK